MTKAKQKTHIVRLGVFVTIALVLFIIATYYIGNNQNLFKPTFRISSVFSNVSGLQPGNNVRFSGIKIGTVEQIVILNDSTLRVDMAVDESVKPFIKKDAIASIGSDGLVGNMVVNINPGKGSGTSVDEGDILKSYSRLKTDDIINTLGKTNENLAVLSNDLLTITDQIINGPGTIGMLLRDSIMADELQASIRNLRATTASLNATSRQLRLIMSDIDAGKGLLGTLVRDTTLKTRVDNMISKLDTTLFLKLDSILVNLDRSGENIAAFSEEVKEFSADLNQDEGLVNSLLRDTAVSNDLKMIMENINEGSVMLNENLEAMRHNFLFRKYFRKQEKEAAKQKK